MESLPQTMKALVIKDEKLAALEDIPIPALSSNEILVKVHSIAQNPSDWMYVDNAQAYRSAGNILGCDFSGVVVKIGPDTATTIKIGDTVAGLEHGGNYKDRGAFAQYVKAQADLVWRFSPSVLSFEGAATMGCALWTSIQALYLRLGLPDPPTSGHANEWILIYGGSTSLGMYSVQLAKLSGYKVVTTVSPKNSELLKALGADIVIDYKAPDVVEQIQSATKNTLKYALDTISNESSQTICVRSFGPTPEGAIPGRLLTVLMPSQAALALRSDVMVQFTLIFTCFGRDFALGTTPLPASAGDRQHMVSWMPKLEDLANSGRLKPNPVKLWSGGLEAVHEGLQYMREGKVSASKIVYNI